MSSGVDHLPLLVWSAHGGISSTMQPGEDGGRCRSDGLAHPNPHTRHSGADTQRNATDFHHDVCSDRSTHVGTAATSFGGASSLPGGPASERRALCIRRPMLRGHSARRAVAFEFTTFAYLFLALLLAAGLPPLNPSHLRALSLLNSYVMRHGMM